MLRTRSHRRGAAFACWSVTERYGTRRIYDLVRDLRVHTQEDALCCMNERHTHVMHFVITNGRKLVGNFLNNYASKCQSRSTRA